MRVPLITLAFALAACSPAGQRWADGTGLTLAEGSLACDWGGTRSAAATGWREREEVGLARRTLGPSPGTGAVDAYFLIAGLAYLDLTRLLPPRWRPVAHALVVLAEADAVLANVRTTGPCGFR